MLEAVSYILNILLTSAYITLRSGHIDKYHEDINKLKENITALTIDCCTYWGMDKNNQEAQKLNIQFTTELFHFQSLLLSYNRRYNSFGYDRHLNKHMTNFRKVATGAGIVSDDIRCDQINRESVNLSNALDQCYIVNRIRYAILPWKKI